ncbi:MULTISPECIES: hypothetical protein [Leisingera]|uniref:hypothetical protein n=1 Tax=Leisingera TaxID=191028 RepID=UPI00047F9E23|nr:MULTISPECIES: hypothetical protein [Leisingera]KIC29328.1 hypothetical protein RA24_06890 [Leisingera sp. ANG-M6]
MARIEIEVEQAALDFLNGLPADRFSKGGYTKPGLLGKFHAKLSKGRAKAKGEFSPEELDFLLDALSDELVAEGIGSDGELNGLGYVIEGIIDQLLHCKN